MTDQDLFNESDQASIDPVDVDLDYLAELTGPGKKFDKTKYTTEAEMYKALAKGKYLADKALSFKEKQFDELNQDFLKERQTNVAGQRLQDLIDQLDAKRNAGSSDITPTNANPEKPFDPKEVESLVSSKIQEHETNKKRKENYDLVVSKLKERYGANYSDSLRTQISELDMSIEAANELARVNPKTFFRLFQLDVSPTREDFQAPPRSDIRTDKFSSKHPKRTWSYYQDMRIKNPELYRNPKTQVQMHKDALDLGDDFQDGNWAALGR